MLNVTDLLRSIFYHTRFYPSKVLRLRRQVLELVEGPFEHTPRRPLNEPPSPAHNVYALPLRLNQHGMSLVSGHVFRSCGFSKERS